ncbi:MAG: HAD-IA family hydrolase [Erythrobacter sp.]
MARFPFTAIGFDLDGTLVDSFRDLGAAVNHALDEGGFEPVPVESSKDLIGGGAKIMLARAVEAQGGMQHDDFRRLYKSMLAFYAENNAVHTAPYAHAREVIAELTARGVRMAVVTNKFEEFARAILAKLDFLEPFETVIGGDSMGKGPDGRYLSKPHPEPVLAAREACGGGRFAFVGDSTYDVKAARAAGVPVVACSYGYCDRPAQQLRADAVIQSLDELVETLDKL